MARLRVILVLILCCASVYSSSLVIEPAPPEEKPEILPPPLPEELYVVSVPRVVRPGQLLDVFINVFPKRRGSIRPIVELRGIGAESDVIHATKTKTIYPYIGGTVSLQAPITLKAGSYRVVISNKRLFSFQHETTVTRDSHTINGFVQTNAGRYNPGSTVMYRILSLDQNLQTYKGNYDVVIYDAARNRIKQDIGISDSTGLIEGLVKLSDEPVMGVWQIHVTNDLISFSKEFEVQKYVLPRFEVTVNPGKSFIVSTEERFVGTISAKYTSGKPVEGRLTVNAKVGTWYLWQKGEQPKLTLDLKIDGDVGYSFSIEELKNISGYIDNKEVTVEAEVVEDLTGEVASGSAKTKVYPQAEKIEFVDSNPSTFKPTMSYIGYVKVLQQDDTPLANPTELLFIDVEIEVPLPKTTTTTTTTTTTIPPTVKEGEIVPIRVVEEVFRPQIWYPFPQPSTYWIKLETLNITVPANGIIQFNQDVPSNATNLRLTARYGKLRTSTTAKRFQSPSDSYLQLTLGTELPKAGKRLTIGVRSNQKFKELTYLVMSRGRIVRARNVRRRFRGQLLNRLSFRVTPEMGPTARLVVYYVRDDNEIVADGLTFNVLGAFKNKVSLKFGKPEVKPGEKVNLKLKANPGSLAATLVVDKSVILLKSGFDLSFTEVLDTLSKFDVGQQNYPTFLWKKKRRRRKRLSILPWPYPTYGGADDVKAVFEESGLKVMTNAVVYDYIEPQIYYPYFRSMAMEDMVFAAAAPGGLASVERIRTRFIETWLWSLVKVGSRGVVNIPLVAPDTMTTWVGTAFAVDTSHGFGMTQQPATIVVLQKFYVNVVLPYSVIRGEQVVLQANVFNYLDKSQKVVVELKNSDDLKCLEVNATGDITEGDCQTQTITIEANSVSSVFFPIIPKVLGQVDITITARTSKHADGLTKQLRVEPEGIPQEYNQAVIVDLTDPDVDTFQETVHVDFPDTLVEGSQRVIVKVLGDLLSNTLNSLSNLLRMSYGCGEQNMINFAPSVFVASYLESVGQLTGERRTKALDIIQSGYQRQMNYIRHDGSFSAFGNSDPSGSTWLSLFVWKSFGQARKFIQLDELRLASTLRFIQRQQNTDGSFNEPGRVIHKDMQGGSANGIALTAYALAAILENEYDDSLNNTITLAQQYVENQIAGIGDPYVLTICAYALELANSPSLPQVRQRVIDAAVKENGQMYWTTPSVFEPHYSWRSPKQRSNAADVEATAYGLLACAEEEDLGRCLTILPWLVSQQNSNGGFVSTQDTVVAVHALSSVASLIYSDDNSVNVDVTSGDITKSFTVDDTNRFVEQTAVLKGNPGDVVIHGTGTGRAVVQVSVRFNIENEFIEPAFSANVTVTKQIPTAFTIQVCAAHLLEEESGMVYIEVLTPTGFSPDPKTEFYLQTYGKRVEVTDKSVVLYLDSLQEEEFCFPVSAIRTALVANVKPVTVTVFDYYEPDQKVVTFYLPDILIDNDFCDVCDGLHCQMCQARRKK